MTLSASRQRLPWHCLHLLSRTAAQQLRPPGHRSSGRPHLQSRTWPGGERTNRSPPLATTSSRRDYPSRLSSRPCARHHPLARRRSDHCLAVRARGWSPRVYLPHSPSPTRLNHPTDTRASCTESGTGNHPGGIGPSRVRHKRLPAAHVARTFSGSGPCVARLPSRAEQCLRQFVPAISRARNQKLLATHRRTVLCRSAPSSAGLTGKPFRAAVWLSSSSARLSPRRRRVSPSGCSRRRGTHSPRRPRLNGLPPEAALRPGPPWRDLHPFVRDRLTSRPGVPSSPGFNGAQSDCFHVEHRRTVLYRIERWDCPCGCRGLVPQRAFVEPDEPISWHPALRVNDHVREVTPHPLFRLVAGITASLPVSMMLCDVVRHQLSRSLFARGLVVPERCLLVTRRLAIEEGGGDGRSHTPLEGCSVRVVSRPVRGQAPRLGDGHAGLNRCQARGERQQHGTDGVRTTEPRAGRPPKPVDEIVEDLHSFIAEDQFSLDRTAALAGGRDFATSRCQDGRTRRCGGIQSTSNGGCVDEPGDGTGRRWGG